MPSNENSSTGNLSTENSVSTVSVKLPSFWAGEPQVWFAQAEAQFVLRRITCSLTKYYHVAAVLPQEIVRSVLDILQDVPTEEPYEELKSRLVQSFALTDYQRAEQFVRLPGLRDRRPSELMNTMLALLASGHPPCFFFNYHFLQRPPADIRGHLITKNVKTPTTSPFWLTNSASPGNRIFQQHPSLPRPAMTLMTTWTNSQWCGTCHTNGNHLARHNQLLRIFPPAGSTGSGELRQPLAENLALSKLRETGELAGPTRFSSRRFSRKRTHFSPNHTFETPSPTAVSWSTQGLASVYFPTFPRCLVPTST